MAKNVTLTLTQAQAQALMALLGGVSAGKADKAPTKKASPKVKKTATFMKYNPDTKKCDIPVKCTPGQKRVWEARRNNYKERPSDEELQAITDAFEWTKDLDKAIKANPSISAKEIHELGGKGCTKQMLKERKVYLKVR